MQSPIDLLHKRVEVLPNMGRLRRKYKPTEAAVINRGHDIMVKFSSICLSLSSSWLHPTFSYLGLESDACPDPGPMSISKSGPSPGMHTCGSDWVGSGLGPWVVT